MSKLTLFWCLIAAAAVGTFSLRLSFIALLEKIREPPWFRASLRYIPAAVLASLVSSSLLIRDGELVLATDNLRLWAALLASLVGYLTRSLLWTILSGLLALFALTYFFTP